MVLDHQYRHLDHIRAVLSLAVSPLQYLVHAPISLYDKVEYNVRNRNELLKENEALKLERLLLKARVQKLSALEKENHRLKTLLKSSAKAGDRVLVAKLLRIDPDPFSHRVIVDKGSFHGVFEGQPILDAYGIMGQIVSVGLYTSVALLITDISHSVPVQSNRSGTRSIAAGIGSLDTLQLSHVTNTSDIKEGDLLVTSGLGQRFPSGYPVGTVIKVKHDPGQSFVRVTVRPSAHLDRSREVLLVWPDGDVAPEWVKNDTMQMQEVAKDDAHEAKTIR